MQTDGSPAVNEEAEALEEERLEESQRLQRGQEILAAPEPTGATARIRVQLPSGERLQRSFGAEQRLAEAKTFRVLKRSFFK